ncbi:universal stress protein [Lentilactobacillus kisonensis]|nr:universal stress protein [Lentilactobacillus kisonensis]KRL23138.1 universal stress family protein [Lentilactobacillus kisonensis DSM 19906 = JCM 15041]
MAVGVVGYEGLTFLEGAFTMYENILVPLDGSANANKALDVAVEFCKVFHAKVTALSVIHHIKDDSDALSSDIYKGLSTKAHKIVESCRDQAWNQGVTINGVVEDGNPKQKIVEFAKENDIDLIIMGKTGMNAFDRMILGSTTNHVVRESGTQVLVVNA